MSFSAAPDARRAMRDALHRLVHETADWSRPSLIIFRNRLLDEVSSDAKPLANLLVEAIDRGVTTALPRAPLPPAAWSARSTPLVMRWVADRFLQPEVARWAVEAWGYALGCIDTSQLTAAVDAPEPVPLAPAWPLVPNQPVSATPGLGTAPIVTAGRAGSPVAASATTASPTAGGRRGAASSGRAPGRAVAPGGARPGALARAGGRTGGAANSWVVANASRVAVGTAVIAMASYVYIFASAARRPVPPPVAAVDARGSAASDTAPVSIPTSFGTPEDNGAMVAALAATTPEATTPGVTGPGATAPGATGPTTLASADRAGSALAAAAAARGIGVGGRATIVPLTAGANGAPSLAMTRLPAEGATPTAFLELAARSNARGRPSDARERGTAGTPDTTLAAVPRLAGVPGITPNALPWRGDADAARRVRPATRPERERPSLGSPFAGGLPNTIPTPEAGGAVPRAAGSPGRADGATTPSPPVASPAGARSTVAPQRLDAEAAPGRAAPTPATPGLDQLRLRSGRRLTGRVEVIRASSVVFRDAETGLRYEFAKDEVEGIITEFGNTVRFRSATSVARGTDRRGTSVAGRYEVTYDAARVNGSPACRDLWRGPSGRDVAEVRHRAGDDTLTVAFVDGDQFPSVLDADGFFASTFRILPGQEQMATALTTRLSGRFGDDGTLALQVNVIGYRRVQGTRGVACHIIVDATGRRRR
jgi:hypothetical protein